MKESIYFVEMAAHIISEEEIRETIYNVMLEIALKQEAKEVIQSVRENKGEFLMKLLTSTIQQICSSYAAGRLHTIRGNKVTLANVHSNFRDLFINMEKIAKLDNQAEAIVSLRKIAYVISEDPIYKKLIGQFLNFYMESQKARPMMITVDMIRETFYNMMAEQVIIKKNVRVAALVDMDSYVFLDLTAFVILDVVCTSVNYKGILLHNQAIVTDTNCPAEYKNFYMMASKLKAELVNLTKEEVELVRVFASSDPEKKYSADQERKKSKKIVTLVTIIKDMAIQISQNENFRQVINDVIKFSIEAH
ncbi:MAG: hypothetical protein Harvfovirus15_9 [Harvfovirus sp.]|uniref:Uncharacterized protein n=1 Tax=Harvfovirus sp. TaxID=2487768 RepID=A0A3G5A1I9_9VIRU|nr:MAG: hypothetical protein Harvfovirus15_9 [Harvfovirus sp.]